MKRKIVECRNHQFQDIGNEPGQLVGKKSSKHVKRGGYILRNCIKNQCFGLFWTDYGGQPVVTVCQVQPCSLRNNGWVGVLRQRRASQQPNILQQRDDSLDPTCKQQQLTGPGGQAQVQTEKVTTIPIWDGHVLYGGFPNTHRGIECDK